MGIAALPANAVRAIGSTQCLTDPVSLVKELIENSLDAKATSIHVEMASDTVARIKVRDNGHGIAPEDRGLVCKRYCTSKIRSLEDLHDLGGQSLGFRGEALASALELSAKIVVSTRIESEEAAVEIAFGRDGLIESEKRLSHPVGSTIEIQQFLSNFPVRKQTAEKNSSKSLARIKTLLQSYALARPNIRLSLKVLKSKTAKGDWSYGPRPGSTDKSSFASLLHDATLKIFGTKATEALRYQAYSWTSDGEIVALTSSELELFDQNFNSMDQYLMECLYIDPERLNNTLPGNFGQHFSIDNRPVSCDRSLLKQISNHYKSNLRSSAERIEIGSKSDPLLVMNLKCPKVSYDVNVEPAKDEVLFYDAEIVLQRVISIFKQIYGEQHRDLEGQFTPEISKDNQKFRTLLAETSVAEEYDDIGPSRTGSASLQRHSEEENEDPHDIRISNPWAFAKMNKPFRTPFRRQENEIRSTYQNHLRSPQNKDGNVDGMPATPRASSQHSPYTSPPFFRSPQRASLQDTPDVSRWSGRSETSNKHQMNPASKPFISPDRVSFDIGEVHKSQKDLSRRFRQSSPVNVADANETIHHSPRNISSPVHPDLALALDYETRKTKATEDHRAKRRREKTSKIVTQQAGGAGQRTIDSLFGQYPTRPSPNSPHKNRQVKAVAALRSNAVIAREGFAERKKLSSKMFPLERVKKECWVSDLVMPLLTTIDAIESQMQKIIDWDDFISHGEVSNMLENVELETLQEWEVQLRQLILNQFRKDSAAGEDGAGIEENNFTFDLNGPFSKPGPRLI